MKFEYSIGLILPSTLCSNYYENNYCSSGSKTAFYFETFILICLKQKYFIKILNYFVCKTKFMAESKIPLWRGQNSIQGNPGIRDDMGILIIKHIPVRIH